MNALGSQLAPRLLAELTMHWSKTGSKLSPAGAAALAIRTWINAQQRPPASATEPPSTRGDQWKSLCPPEGTELRMSTVGSTYHARVVGDDIVYHGRKVSPRRMTLAIAGRAATPGATCTSSFRVRAVLCRPAVAAANRRARRPCPPPPRPPPARPTA